MSKFAKRFNKNFVAHHKVVENEQQKYEFCIRFVWPRGGKKTIYPILAKWYVLLIAISINIKHNGVLRIKFLISGELDKLYNNHSNIKLQTLFSLAFPYLIPFSYTYNIFPKDYIDILG